MAGRAPGVQAVDSGAGAAGLERCWALGDADTFGEIDRRYRARLIAVADRILGNRADAEDVVQRVFVALPRAGFRGAANLGTYLYRAATNGALNVLRARRRHDALERAVEARALLGELPGSAPPAPDAQVLEAQSLAAVARALLRVRPRHRRVLLLRIVWGLSNSEIAEREALPLATVGTRLRRGRLELRRELAPLLRELRETRP